jgi:hypothetical protein
MRVIAGARASDRTDVNHLTFDGFVPVYPLFVGTVALPVSAYHFSNDVLLAIKSTVSEAKPRAKSAEADTQFGNTALRR